MAFTVRLSEAAPDVVTVQYRTLNGSALVESEVVSWSSNQLVGTLTFAPGEQVMALMFDLNRELGTTLVLVTHDRGIADRCERRITIEAGRVGADEKRA